MCSEAPPRALVAIASDGPRSIHRDQSSSGFPVSRRQLLLAALAVISPVVAAASAPNGADEQADDMMLIPSTEPLTSDEH